MKKVAIVGIGVGKDTITLGALEAIQGAGVLIGAQRMLDAVSGLGIGEPKCLYPRYTPEDVADAVAAEDAERFAFLVSGDAGFYSAAAKIGDALRGYDLRIIPGVSTVNAFFAKWKLPWQEAAFFSAHGRVGDITAYVRRNHLTFCLTGNNVRVMGAALDQAGLGHVKTYVGENLGDERERVYETFAGCLAEGEYPSLTVLLFENEGYDERTPIGLPDSRFSRLAGVPMTKSETRAIIMAKLALRPSSICWDVGAGSGSVTVEMALGAYRGHVYAVERREEAIPLIGQNCASFHVGNVSVICGEAPEVLEALPVPDAVFIGGSGGGIGDIIQVAWEKNPGARVVVTAVTPETVSLVLTAFKSAGAEPEITQINAARGKQAGGLHLMEAQNPVTILCAGGTPWA